MTKKKHDTEAKTELEKRLEAEAAAEEAQEHEAAPSEPAVTQEAYDKAVASREEAKDQYLRMRAELENFRKRTNREVERIRSVAAEAVLKDLLPVLDHLELALQHADDPSGGLAEGVDMVMKQFREALARHGLAHIPALNQPFDPNVHEAVMQREDETVPEHTVIEEFQKGYALNGVVVRPAKVVVSTGGPTAPAEAAEEQAEPEEDATVHVNVRES